MIPHYIFRYNILQQVKENSITIFPSLDLSMNSVLYSAQVVHGMGNKNKFYYVVICKKLPVTKIILTE